MKLADTIKSFERRLRYDPLPQALTDLGGCALLSVKMIQLNANDPPAHQAAVRFAEPDILRFEKAYTAWRAARR